MIMSEIVQKPEKVTTKDVEVVDIEIQTSEHKCGKRKLTSSVWLEFRKVKVSDGVVDAICNYCRKKFNGSSSSGTTHLRNHLNRCPLRNHRMQGQQLLQTTVERCEDNAIVNVKNFKFDQERSRADLARMVMKHRYPFNLVEHEYFHVFVNNLQPMFKIVSRNTLKADILKVYKMEKEKLYKCLDALPSRISLTTDLWTSDTQNIAYCCLTCHFIDDKWVLRKKIIAFPKVESRHDGESLSEIIISLLLEWNIEKKICSLTVDNATANDVMTKKLNSWLCGQQLLPLSGAIFHIRCAAHILNLIVQEGYKVINGMLKKIKGSVAYVNSSPQRKQQFKTVLNQLKLQNRNLPGDDVPTRWNSTYLMLQNALGIKEAFSRLEQVDKMYKFNPSKEEWEIGEIVCKCLKIFYDATCKLSGVKYSTANLYFPIVCGIQNALMKWEDHDQHYVQDMADLMKQKFEKYWSECNLVMAIGVILDPRFKLDVVEYFMNEIYGISAELYLVNIRGALHKMFGEYNDDSSNKSSSSSSFVDCTHSHPRNSWDSSADCLEGFTKWYEQTRTANIIASQKSELDRYLEEPIIRAPEFDVLNWWRDNAARFPVLGKMARDVLAIPMSTVASESAFSVGGNIIEPNRHALGADIVQALLCGQDWIELPKEKVSRRAMISMQSKSETL